MKMKLVICTADENYASRFVDYFNIHYGDKVELIQFTEYVYLAEYLKNKTVDICLLGSELVREEVELGQAIPVLLTEEKDEAASIKTIFKYQRAENIYKELLNVLADRKTGIKLFRRRDPGCGMEIYQFL